MQNDSHLVTIGCDRCSGTGEVERDLGIIGFMASCFIGDFKERCPKCNGRGCLDVYMEPVE